MMYASRNWKATETTDLIGSKYTLTVSGEVQVRRSNQTPKLAEAQSPGINLKILILNLTVESQGDLGGDIVEWKPVEYSREVSPRHYGQVTITGETDEQTIEVEVVLS